MVSFLLIICLALSVGFSLFIYDRLVKLENVLSMMQYDICEKDYVGAVKGEYKEGI